MSLEEKLKEKNSELIKSSQFRSLEILGSGQGPVVQINGHPFVNLCSNDYLSLAGDRRLKDASISAIEKWGTGSGASRLLSGNLEIHQELENEAATLVSKEASLCFASGYAANVGLVSCLIGKNDAIFSDELNHASLIDGCRLSKAETYIYEHLNLNNLERQLAENRNRFDQAFLITESYFSMNGDLAPLSDLSDLCRQYDTNMIVDEAHGIGVFGGGRGVCFEKNITDKVAAIIGTFGKAIGSQGAFVAGSNELRSFLVNRARSFVFSTAMAPAIAASALEGIRILRREGEEQSRNLIKKCDKFRKILNEHQIPVLAKSTGPIVPILIGDISKTIAIAGKLFEENIFARAIRPPTVPEGTSRIRCTLTSGHSDEDLLRVAKIIGKL